MLKSIKPLLVHSGLTVALALSICGAAAASACPDASARKDSTGLERKNGKVLVLYKVEPGETLFAIARKYRTTVPEVQKLNPGMASSVKSGQIVRVPPLSLITVLAGASQNYRQPPGQASPGSEVEKVHVVKAGETLFAISRQYKVSVADLKAMNKLESTSLHEGQQLIVSKQGGEGVAKSEPKSEGKKEQVIPPAPKEEGGISMSKSPEPKKEESKKEEARKPAESPKQTAAEPAKAEVKPVPAHENPAQQAPAKAGYVRHTVKPGETLFAIARLYNADVKLIEQENKIAGGQVNTGQVLDIRQGAPIEEKPAVGLAEEVSKAKGAPVDSMPASEPSSSTNSTMGYERIVEHGMAEVVENESGAKNYFCLHRTAPVGRIVQIKNEMNGATIYARVIGKLPETGNNDKVTVKISRKAFDKLSAADKRFPVEISYPAQ